MTKLEWYFHNRRMIEHYEDEESSSLVIMLFMWTLSAVCAIAAVLLAINIISYWWVAVIPGGICFVLGMLSFVNYLSAKEMIEWIKWRM